MRIGCLLVAVSMAAALVGRCQTLEAQRDAPLRLGTTIPLSDVKGRIDHFSVGVKGQRLFVSALGNNTLEILELNAARRVHSIGSLREPQGVLFVPGFNRLFVANADGGACLIFDSQTYDVVGTVDFADDADNIRYDKVAKLVYVGYGSGALGVIDPKEGKRVREIKLEGHPESFQIETAGPRIFVNVPTAGHIAVIDRRRGSIVAKWAVAPDRENFPLALDEPHHRLFVTCRKPAEILVFDTDSGKVVARHPVVGDADDMFYDSVRRRIYVSGGEGFLSVVGQETFDHYRTIAKIPTARGARTSFFVPEFNRLYLAVPHRGQQNAEIRVYEVQP